MDVIVSRHLLEHGGHQRDYLLIRPADIETQDLPVVMDLHGSGLRPEDQARTSNAYATAQAAVVVVPSGLIPFQVRTNLPPATTWSIPGAPLPGEDEIRPEVAAIDDVAFVVDLAQSTEPREVVGFEVILGAYSPLSIAAMGPVSLSG